MYNDILLDFGLNTADYSISSFGSGLINHTLKVSGRGEDFILQQVNTDIFKSPGDIADNIVSIQQYLKQIAPDYLFVSPLLANNGTTLVKSSNGEVYRLFPFVKNSHTVDFVNDEKQAYEAAQQFGRFTRLLKDFDIASLKYPLSDFHNLNLRWNQFITACKNAEKSRFDTAFAEIKQVHEHQDILKTYNQLIEHNEIPLRVIHHDTKISNVLFDDQQNGLCVIDLDTVMPGYYLSDVGDMMRTYLSPANEEETDLDKICIRENIFVAIHNGYLSEMGDALTQAERRHFTFSGQMMIYMQAIRFLTDYFNNDVYYGSRYTGHNLMRAKNQLKLLSEYKKTVAGIKL
ncbi:phosphotransferase enzyme family protein [Mucilaginibacter jinjuensis]|uniref:Aminoglycoside phosphotransferase family protein n=1 Tax=Mucilaginibacter jinjuensis TaxID=1176721 RepID=A0ABY7T0S3_9SPHI|nr:aminoglycoside phosphotransferase family protein [Mucilaginibacter jinjuensis]WCT09853.1 aminoglycoside phosphotransferase family protein [Mucilaginibacter jinjuensis]